ncbi:MAG: glycosyltransferase family 4 protein [Acidimicrobiia bacterium]|nr:glycosyltransferase family 4 protein [Acidimicrobiia bacterium]
MRVSLLCPYSLSVPGGVQGQVLGLARALRAIGVDARVIGPTDGPPPEPGVTTVGATVGFSANGSISPMAEEQRVASDRTLEALRAFAPDVLHLHEPLVPGPTSAALLGSDIPKVGTFHAAGEAGSPAYKALRKIAETAARRLAVRVAVSPDAREMAEAALGGSYLVLPNGVDIDAFAKVNPWPAPRPSVLFLGRHEPRKGLGVLLDAWTGLDRDAVLWVASDGPETAGLMGRHTPDVEWLGRISEPEKLARLRGATIFCSPAVGQESFGIVLLEGMAAGTAVLASDIPGYRNVAHHEVDALLVAPDDPDALRVALRRLLDSDRLRAGLETAASEHVGDFSLHRLAERYVEVYEMAIAVGGSGMPSIRA